MTKLVIVAIHQQEEVLLKVIYKDILLGKFFKSDKWETDRNDCVICFRKLLRGVFPTSIFNLVIKEMQDA